MEAVMRSTAKLKNDIIDLCLIIPEGSVGVEIGCFKGESTKMFIDSGKFKRLHCVDPWDPKYYRAHDMATIEKEFREGPGSSPIVKTHKTTGHDFFEWNKDSEINFVYIDGDHSYEALHQDISDWLSYLLKQPKRKPIKILAGHDYRHPGSPGVEKAVRQLLGYPDLMCAGYSWAKIIRI